VRIYIHNNEFPSNSANRYFSILKLLLFAVYIFLCAQIVLLTILFFDYWLCKVCTLHKKTEIILLSIIRLCKTVKMLMCAISIDVCYWFNITWSQQISKLIDPPYCTRCDIYIYIYIYINNGRAEAPMYWWVKVILEGNCASSTRCFISTSIHAHSVQRQDNRHISRLDA